MARQVVVAGGGASGLTAAIYAARNGADVTILEHRDSVGKKILMTGNGKCNLTNMSDVHGKYYSSDERSLEKVYDTLVRFDAKKTRSFFMELGLFTKEKRDGGVYPVSEQAAVVLDVLRSACSSLGIRIITDCEIKEIIPPCAGAKIRIKRYIRENAASKAKKKPVVSEQEESISYDRIILATGGRAAPKSGSDGSGYVLARKLGHSIIEPLPALVQLKCAGDFFPSISGVRAQCRLSLYIDGKESAVEEGELQLTDYGISGIPVFQFSRIAAKALHAGQKCEVRINFIPYLFDAGYNENSNRDLIKKDTSYNEHLIESLPKKDTSYNKNLIANLFIKDAIYNENTTNKKSFTENIFCHKTVEELLAGLVHKKIAAMVCKKNGIYNGMTVAQALQVCPKKINGCIQMLMDFRVQITDTNSFENAQVCCGGVPLSEVDGQFRSVKAENVYIVGELLDCDGICGGYNLQWAWATGAIAGESAALDDIGGRKN